ncbi:MAG: RNA methyltransferase [Flammeovirgaceae bacterium]|nr:RNA methyltransferase [Flammeovirgaceae bacterium]
MNEEEYTTGLTEFLGQYVSDHKRELLENVLGQRTRFIAIVLEDIYQSQNASAAIRTCECMGIQDIHIVENSSKYAVNRRVMKGANKWVDLIRYKQARTNNTEECFKMLRSKGYKIVATDPGTSSKSIHELEIDQKIALVMGNELRGLSEFTLNHADLKVHIPMYGFTESMNVSASMAVCLNSLLPKLRSSNIPWQLTEEEKNDIRLRWYKSIIKRSDALERQWRSKR